MRMSRAVLVLVLAAGAACSQTAPRHSRDVATRDMVVEVRTDAHVPGRIVASVEAFGGAIILGPGDRLVLTQESVTWPFNRSHDSYLADVGVAAGTYALRLERTDDETAIATFFVPPPFRVTAPAAATSSEAVSFAWDGQVPGAHVSFSVEGPCIASVRRELQVDAGSYLLNAGELRSVEAPLPCELVLTVTRELVSTVASSTLARFRARLEVVAMTTIAWTP